MKKTLIYMVLALVISSVAVSCSGSKLSNKGCGCNMNKGYVGY